MKISSLALLAAICIIPVAASGTEATVHLCKASVQAKIDMVDAQMRKGHDTNQAHKLLARRDRLRKLLKACDKNPDAYRKNL